MIKEIIFYFKPTWDEQPGFCFYSRDRWSALCSVSLFLYCYEIFENRCSISITRSALTGDVCVCLHLITFFTSKISSGSSSICWVMFGGSLWGGQGKSLSDAGFFFLRVNEMRAGSFCCSRIRSSCNTQVCSSYFTSVATKIVTPWWVLMGFITGSSLCASWWVTRVTTLQWPLFQQDASNTTRIAPHRHVTHPRWSAGLSAAAAEIGQHVHEKSDMFVIQQEEPEEEGGEYGGTRMSGSSCNMQISHCCCGWRTCEWRWEMSSERLHHVRMCSDSSLLFQLLQANMMMFYVNRLRAAAVLMLVATWRMWSGRRLMETLSSWLHDEMETCNTTRRQSGPSLPVDVFSLQICLWNRAALFPISRRNYSGLPESSSTSPRVLLWWHISIPGEKSRFPPPITGPTIYFYVSSPGLGSPVD